MKTVLERPRREDSVKPQGDNAARPEGDPPATPPGDPPETPQGDPPRPIRSVRPAGAVFRSTSADTLELPEPPLTEFTPRSSHGLVVADRYRILEQIAEGGMGSVYIAEQVALGRKVAVKIVVNPDEAVILRMQREAHALAEISHPAVVEILDFITLVDPTSTRGCLVMAYIDGVDLREYQSEQPEAHLDPFEVRVLMLPIVSALVELHAAGILHRDIKPDNLVRFVRADGRPGVILVDFGIARRSTDMGITAAGTLVGTPPYMSPEILNGEAHSPYADIYAFGATLFELLTGEPPNGKGAIPEILKRALYGEPTFPERLQGTAIAELVSRMLSTDPLERPDAKEVLHDLERMRDPLRGVGGASVRRRAGGADADLLATTTSLRTSRARRAPSVESDPLSPEEEADSALAPEPASTAESAHRTSTATLVGIALGILAVGVALGAGLVVWLS